MAGDLDEIFLRALKLEDEVTTDASEAELAKLLPALVDAGYAEEFGHSSTGSFWSWTDEGVRKADELGWWDATPDGEE